MSALNIKNEEAVRLVKELADLKGESLTTVVIEAVREKLDRERAPVINDARMQYWLDFGKRVRETADPEWLAKDPFEDLYDELGLPK
ncbi:MAG: type II toxin-antitoxin system VapB family antitoxin [Chloroflexia bacterium]|nr:type II toxin-antitoxin system VapB family antitoxin [Chloroflexia bacterium]